MSPQSNQTLAGPSGSVDDHVRPRERLEDGLFLRRVQGQTAFSDPPEQRFEGAIGVPRRREVINQPGGGKIDGLGGVSMC